MKTYNFVLVSIFLFLATQLLADNGLPAEEEQIFSFVEEMPVYPDGDAGIRNFLESVKYPQEAMEARITGTVFIRFTVNKEAKVTDVHVVRSSGHEILDQAALQHIKDMPDWHRPGKQRNEAVNVVFTMPVRFSVH